MGVLREGKFWFGFLVGIVAYLVYTNMVAKKLGGK
jgi:hypothetical protein